MDSLLKLLLFALFFIIAAVAAYRCYQFFNQKIRASDTGWQLLLYVSGLVLCNIILFFGSIAALLKLYLFLSR